MNCPNGCSAELMEYESYGGLDSDRIEITQHHPPQAEYCCHGCGWAAIWTRGAKVVVLLNPGDTVDYLEGMYYLATGDNEEV